MKGGSSIYLITRVHGLRRHLILPRDIQTLAKAKNLSDITASLMKTEYAADISQLPTQEQDAATLEGVFLKKLTERFFFVRRSAQGRMQDLLTRYCARFEVENVKRILRAKHGGQRSETPTLIPLPREHSIVNYPALLEAKDVDEVASLLRDTPYRLIAKIQSYKESGTTLILESTLDKTYFTRLWELARRTRSIRNLVGEEIDLRNLLVALFLKTRELPSRLIEETMIPPFYTVLETRLRAILQGRLEDAPNIVTPRYSHLVTEAANLLKSSSSLPLEWLFYKQLYGDATMISRTDSLQAGYIIAYLLLCECEAKNLISIVTGKQLKLNEEKISKGLFGV
jgi:vacuolar-type H+-ATPase subunit C/Vma6